MYIQLNQQQTEINTLLDLQIVAEAHPAMRQDLIEFLNENLCELLLIDSDLSLLASIFPECAEHAIRKITNDDQLFDKFIHEKTIIAVLSAFPNQRTLIIDALLDNTNRFARVISSNLTLRLLKIRVPDAHARIHQYAEDNPPLFEYLFTEDHDLYHARRLGVNTPVIELSDTAEQARDNIHTRKAQQAQLTEVSHLFLLGHNTPSTLLSSIPSNYVIQMAADTGKDDLLTAHECNEIVSKAFNGT